MMRVLNREGLQQIIVYIVNKYTGLSADAVVWATDPQKYVGDQDRAKITLRVFSMSALGVDEHRRTFSAPGQPAGSFETVEIGNRHIIIQMEAEVFDGYVEASELLDIIRTGIRSELVTAKLNALNLAFVWAEQATQVHRIIDTRYVNTAIVDFTFAGIARQVTSVVNAAVAVPVVDNVAQGDWIETVDTTNQIPGSFE